jgi:hypothetical protein
MNAVKTDSFLEPWVVALHARNAFGDDWPSVARKLRDLL